MIIRSAALAFERVRDNRYKLNFFTGENEAVAGPGAEVLEAKAGVAGAATFAGANLPLLVDRSIANLTGKWDIVTHITCIG